VASDKLNKDVTNKQVLNRTAGASATANRTITKTSTLTKKPADVSIFTFRDFCPSFWKIYTHKTKFFDFFSFGVFGLSLFTKSHSF
jgi:hypothetical protein